MIGDPTHDQREQQQRQELDKPDHAKLESGLAQAHPARTRDIVDLPADHYDHRVLRENQRDPRDEKGPKLRDLKRVGWIDHGAV